MTSPRPRTRAVYDLVKDLTPGDDVEAQQQADTLAWLERTDDVYRRIPPATPARHLVSYVVLIDPTDGSVLLVDHLKAELWLPAGGHVEPDEHPAQTARREASEELGLSPVLISESPAFVSVTQTIGPTTHTDVSLWFLLAGRRGQALTPDPREFTRVRWWTPVEAQAESAVDPAFHRFARKITSVMF